MRDAPLFKTTDDKLRRQSPSENEVCPFNALCDTVMPGLVPGIHAATAESGGPMDGRVKPGHDEISIVH